MIQKFPANIQDLWANLYDQHHLLYNEVKVLISLTAQLAVPSQVKCLVGSWTLLNPVGVKPMLNCVWNPTGHGHDVRRGPP
jgi:hypothetical protein